MEEKGKHNKYTIIKWSLPSAIFLIVSFLIISMYSNQINKNLRNMKSEQLEVTSNLFWEKINTRIIALETAVRNAAYELALSDNQSEIMQHLKETQSASSVRIYNIESETGVDQDGNSCTLEQEVYDAYRLGKATAQCFNKNIYSIITPVVKEDNVKEILEMQYELKNLDEIFIAENTMGKKSFFLLFDHEGMVQYCFSDDENNIIYDTPNFLDILTKRNSKEVYSVLNTISMGRSSNAQIEINHEQYYFYYIKAESIHDSYFAMAVPKEYLDISIDHNLSVTKNLRMWLVATAVLFIVMQICVGVMEQVNRNKKSSGLKHLAEIDQLTGLYNKITTENKIKSYIDENPEGSGILFVLDIDNFKKINDTMGHAFGDEVLRTIGQQIKREFRTSDIIGRAGGDEFIIFVKNISDIDLIKRHAKRIESFFQGFKAGGYVKYSATASIGCAIYTQDGNTFETIYKAADSALYKAKQRGKNQLAFYKDLEDFGQHV